MALYLSLPLIIILIDAKLNFGATYTQTYIWLETFDFFQSKNIEKRNKTSKYSPSSATWVIFYGGVMSRVFGGDQFENWSIKVESFVPIPLSTLTNLLNLKW